MDSVSSNNLGALSEEGKFVSKSYTDAMSLYSRACMGGSIAGCMNLGNMYAKGKGVARNKEVALSFYAQACEMGYQEGCDLYYQLHK